ncbi:MAG: phosphatase PAP2 family protein [Nitrospirae bacterium]|nr:phosphatase PAP2 family protein [Nitrospirota bacterium]
MNPLQVIDRKLFLLINKGLSSSFLDFIMPFVTEHVHLLLIPVLLFVLLKKRKLFITTLILSVVALSLSDNITNILKHLFERPRPFLTIKETLVLVGKGGSYSMPSAHASNVFAVVTVFCYFLGRIREVPTSRLFVLYSVLVGLMVGFSRIYVGVHYPLDVLVGSVLGITVGLFTLFGYVTFSNLLKERRALALLMLFLLGMSLFRLYYITTGPLDLSPDEAHYWDWSRNPDLSYYSKGPGIAYIIWFSRLLFGNTEIGVRMPAVIFLFSSSIIIFFLTRSLSVRFDGFESVKRQEQAGLVASIGLNILPLFATYGVVNTIDSPFIFFWTAALALFWYAVKDWPLKRASLWRWLMLGVVVGLGGLVKYTMVFFVFSAFLFLVFNREKRGLLKSIYPWLSSFVSAIVTSPIIIWNYQHNWVTFRHTAGQAHVAEGLVIRPERFLEFIGSQLGVIGPVVFVFMIVAVLWSRKVKRDEGFVFWFFAPTFLFFLLKSLQGKVQANWALPCYISALVGLAIYVVAHWRAWTMKLRATFVVGVVISFMITAIAHYPSFIKLPPKMDPSSRLRGWHQLGQEVSRIVSDMKKPYFIFSDRYQVTSELAFYVKGNPRTYCVNLGRRMNQYDLWPGFHKLKGYDAVFVRMGRESLPERLEDVFDRCERKLLTIEENGYILRTYSIFVCRNFHGMERKPPDRF